MNMFSTISQALRTGEPLHEASHQNLIDRFHYHGTVATQSLADETTLNDPFADRPRQINFAAAPTMPTPMDSVVSFPNEFGTLDQYDEDEEEKLPLNRGAGGLYPPA